MAIALQADLEQILQEAGATQAFTDYFVACRILTPDVVALLSPDADHFTTIFVDAFVNRVTISGSEFQTDIQEHATRAILLHIRSRCLEYRAARQAKAAACLLPSTQQLQPQQQQQVPPPTTSSAVPKTLQPGVWNQQISRYNKIQLNGVDRDFPCLQLLGAEQVLARLLHEHTCSKQYTPLKLGEILQARAYTSAGQVNWMATRAKRQRLQLDGDNTLSSAADEVWTPGTH